MLLECVADYAEESGTEARVDVDTPLLGAGAAVSSLGLVMIVTSFEARLSEAYDAPIVLANESAMSMRVSPFRSVAALVEYADQLLREHGTS
ncbi:MAG: hypothetical protein ACREQJ_11560 [Candidatus Binatia bacterium]